MVGILKCSLYNILYQRKNLIFHYMCIAPYSRKPSINESVVKNRKWTMQRKISQDNIGQNAYDKNPGPE